MKDSPSQDGIFTPITLPCGRSVPNRLVKVAMYEHLADFLGGPPNDYHYSLYSKWARFGWGMVITGNVQVSNDHLTLGRDMVISHELSEECIQPFKQLAASIHGSGERKGLAIMQLSHAGRQSTNFIGGRLPFRPPLAPSAIRVTSKQSGWLENAVHILAFQQPITMSVEDIDNVVKAYIKASRMAFESGFDGIQLHAAHGYLLAQFISLKSNNRQDDYSVNSTNVLRVVRRIVAGIRSATSKSFVIGIKLNAADYADDVDAFQRVLGHFKSIAQWGEVDFIEVSGGDYEKPDFIATKSSRQGLFSEFSKATMDALESLSLGASSPLILLTGGLRTPELLHTALVSRHAHLLGIGRLSVLCPNFPDLLEQLLLNGAPDHTYPCWSAPICPEPQLDASSQLLRFIPSIPLIGAGVNMAWYIVAMRRLADRHSSSTNITDSFLIPGPDYTLGPFGAIFWMWMWTDTASLRFIVLISLVVSLLAITALVL